MNITKLLKISQEDVYYTVNPMKLIWAVKDQELANYVFRVVRPQPKMKLYNGFTDLIWKGEHAKEIYNQITTGEKLL